MNLRKLSQNLAIVALGILSVAYTLPGASPLPSALAQNAEGGSPLTPELIANSLLQDFNGNGILEVIAFGDSITRGVGDFVASGTFVEESFAPVGEAGYPLRIETFLVLEVENLGDPGERFITEGLPRFARTIPALKPDIVIISGGSNDAIFREPTSAYFTAAQTMINIAKASGSLPLLVTIPPACCSHSGTNPIVDAYNARLRQLANINSVPLADANQAFVNTCFIGNCVLLNLPEGLHPNIDGYQVMGETVVARLLNIDLFAPDGAATLEQALNLQAGSVRTQPNPQPIEVSATG